MEERIVEILNSVADHARPGNTRSPYTRLVVDRHRAAQRFEPDFVKRDRPVGGSGAGKRALTTYMANQLSKRIKAGKSLARIEMLFLHPAQDTKANLLSTNIKTSILSPRHPPADTQSQCIDFYGRKRNGFQTPGDSPRPPWGPRHPPFIGWLKVG